MRFIELHPNNKLTCWRCNCKFTSGYRLEIRNGFFRGDDEVVSCCLGCYQSNRMNEDSDIKIIKKYRKQKSKNILILDELN